MPTSLERVTVAMSTERTTGAGAGAKVLLVEDHPDIGEMMLRFLTMSSYDARWATSVSAALVLARAERFDVLISDLTLPDGTGIDLMRELRETDPAIKGIALSGRSLDEDRALTRGAGFSQHLVKPIDMDKLLSTLQQIAPKRSL